MRFRTPSAAEQLTGRGAKLMCWTSLPLAVRADMVEVPGVRLTEKQRAFVWDEGSALYECVNREERTPE